MKGLRENGHDVCLCYLYPNLPSVNFSALSREVDTDFINFPCVRLKGFGILLVFNLLEGLICTLVNLKLYDVEGE